MTDVELNEQVARRLGRATEPIKFEDGVGFVPSWPNYVRDIAAAWDLVEVMHSNGFEMELMQTSSQWQIENPMQKWMIYMRRYNVDKNPFVNLFSDAAPRAICLAFLKLTEEKQ